MPLPADAALPALVYLFDSEWVWRAFCGEAGPPAEAPDRLRFKDLLYWPGAQAVASYVAERRWGAWLAEEEFAIELVAGKPERVFRYPDDPYLPGLARVASAPDAQQLISQYVRLHPQRLHVEAVRYRPTTRAVLRHVVGWRRAGIGELTLFVRAMPPARVGRLLAAGELAERSGFALPRLAGSWPEGGVVWLAAIPGETVRTLIRRGEAPDPGLILDGLARLWAAPATDAAVRALDLGVAFRWTEGLLAQVLEDDEGRRALQRAIALLRPFVEAWRPTALAHNDFYDDQMILMPDGRLALVDFEETAPGDPLLDVGNLLAHLRWMARFGIAPETCEAYRRDFRQAALARFGWSEPQLALREAFALFRLSTNPVRQLQPDWSRQVATGLTMVAEALAEAA